MGSRLTHDDTHLVEAFVMQVVHWLAVDEFLLAATLETAAVVHGCGGRVAAVRHLHTGEGGMREMSFIPKVMLKYCAE